VLTTPSATEQLPQKYIVAKSDELTHMESYPYKRGGAVIVNQLREDASRPERRGFGVAASVDTLSRFGKRGQNSFWGKAGRGENRAHLLAEVVEAMLFGKKDEAIAQSQNGKRSAGAQAEVFAKCAIRLAESKEGPRREGPRWR
jgi:hypothetical protein